MLLCEGVQKLDLMRVGSVNLRVKRSDNRQTKCRQSSQYSERQLRRLVSADAL